MSGTGGAVEWGRSQLIHSSDAKRKLQLPPFQIHDPDASAVMFWKPPRTTRATPAKGRCPCMGLVCMHQAVAFP